jgi:hypothetical protein
MGVPYESKVLVHFCRAVKFETVRANAPVFETGDAKFAISNIEIERTKRVHGDTFPQKARFSDQLWAASSELAFCEQ